MANRKSLQVPGQPRGPRNNRRPQPNRGFWEWLIGGYYRNG
jgi:hypothetical protein